MSDTWRRLIIVSIVCYLVAFAIVLLLSILSFSNLDALPEFQREWIVSRTVAEFLALAPVAQAWAILITYSLVVPMQSSSPAGTGFDRFASPVVVLLVVTIMFSFAYGIAHPRVVNRRASIEESSEVAEGLMRSVETATRSQDYRRALTDLDQYILIVGESDELQEQRSDLLRNALMDAAKNEQDRADDTVVRDTVADSRELASRAQVAQLEEDYSTAHYLATLARSLDPGNDEAAQIAADSLRRMEEALPDSEESAQAELFRRTLEAKQSLDRGEVIHAYQQLSALAEQHPTNMDIARYLATAADKAAKLSVSMDEVEWAMQLPGTTQFAFVNRADSTSTEIVAIGKLVGTSAGLYAHHIEVMRFSVDGKLEYHITSDYGKLIDSSLVLTVLEPDNPTGSIEPVVRHASSAGVPGSVIELSPSAHDLWLLGVASADPARASVTDLVRTVRTLPRYGVISEPVTAELLYRLSLPFTFLLLGILTLGFSWRYRSRYLSRPPILTFIVVPLAPLVLLPVHLFLQYAHRILFSALLLWTSFTVATILLVVLEGILLAVSLMYLALSSRE